jgi:hypothetical protein
MLYLHFGLPRTSTTSLQNALFVHRKELAAAGIVYPERWIAGGSSHHGLVKFLTAALESEADFADFKRFLSDHAEQEVVFSVEGVTYWLFSRERREALLGLLAAAEDVMPVRCVWTLRRLDRLLVSLYLLWLMLGRRLPPVENYFRRARAGDWLFSGMQEIDDALGGTSVYLKYEPCGSHNRQLIQAIGVPGSLGAEIEQELDKGTRINPSPTHKQAVICLNRDLFSARMGIDLNRAALRDAVYRGDLDFDDDRPCELLDDDTRRDLHERGLAEARLHAFEPYLEFFSDADLGCSTPVSLDPDVVTNHDLERLAHVLPR